jgi:hypothetical protein
MISFVFITLAWPISAHPAGITDVLSSGDSSDAFDGSLSLRWDWSLRDVSISREFYCDSSVPGCPSVPSTQTRSELEAQRVRHVLGIDARIGLYRGFEFYLDLPLVISDRTNLSFANGVGIGNSSVYDGTVDSLFPVDHEGAKRSGIGDLVLGFRYAPLQQWRVPQHPTLVLDLGYEAPTGKVKRADNSAVGEGVHTLHLAIAASHRIRFVEPYFQLSGDVRFPNTTSESATLYRNHDSATQMRVGPGATLGLTAGTEWFPWRLPRPDRKPGRFATIDLGFSAAYTFPGREATELFEALGTSPCAGRGTSCSGTRPDKNLLAYDRTLDGVQAGIAGMDGITDVSGYGAFSVWAGFRVQPVQFFELAFRFTYTRETARFLTNADTGKNLDSTNNTIDWKNANGQNEFNPVYNSDVDDPGRRFRSDGGNIYGVLLYLTGKL